MTANNISAGLEKKRLEDKVDNIVLNFSDGVIPMGGVIKINRHDGKVIEQIKLGSEKTTGDLYHSSSMVWDYSYNLIALENYEIFKHLANHANVEIGDKTEEEWADELRSLWNISVNGNIYRLDKDKYSSTDESYNYHATTPEYTPGEDKSGTGDIILSPLGGIKKLTFNSSKLEPSTSYIVKLDNSRLLSATGNSTDYLKFNEPLRFEVIDARDISYYEYDDEYYGYNTAKNNGSNSYYAGELSAKKRQSISMSDGAKFSIEEIDNGNFAIAKNRKELKRLSRSNVDVVYDKTTGKLYLNDNLKGKGWAKKGQSSLLAKFKGKPNLSNSNFDSLIDYSKEYDKSGAKYSVSKWFLNAYRNTPRSQLFKLFKDVKKLESALDSEDGMDAVAMAIHQDRMINSDAWTTLWKNSPNQDPRYQSGINNDQYYAFKRSFLFNGDAEMVTQGKEEYIFF